MKRKQKQRSPVDTILDYAEIYAGHKDAADQASKEVKKYREKLFVLLKKHGEKTEEGHFRVEIPDGGEILLQRRAGRLALDIEACDALDPMIKKRIRKQVYDPDKIREAIDEGIIPPDVGRCLVREGDETFALYVKFEDRDDSEEEG